MAKRSAADRAKSYAARNRVKLNSEKYHKYVRIQSGSPEELGRGSRSFYRGISMMSSQVSADVASFLDSHPELKAEFYKNNPQLSGAGGIPVDKNSGLMRWVGDLRESPANMANASKQADLSRSINRVLSDALSTGDDVALRNLAISLGYDKQGKSAVDEFVRKVTSEYEASGVAPEDSPERIQRISGALATAGAPEDFSLRHVMQRPSDLTPQEVQGLGWAYQRGSAPPVNSSAMINAIMSSWGWKEQKGAVVRQGGLGPVNTAKYESDLKQAEQIVSEYVAPKRLFDAAGNPVPNQLTPQVELNRAAILANKSYSPIERAYMLAKNRVTDWGQKLAGAFGFAAEPSKWVMNQSTSEYAGPFEGLVPLVLNSGGEDIYYGMSKIAGIGIGQMQRGVDRLKADIEAGTFDPKNYQYIVKAGGRAPGSKPVPVIQSLQDAKKYIAQQEAYIQHHKDLVAQYESEAKHYYIGARESWDRLLRTDFGWKYFDLQTDGGVFLSRTLSKEAQDKINRNKTDAANYEKAAQEALLVARNMAAVNPELAQKYFDDGIRAKEASIRALIDADVYPETRTYSMDGYPEGKETLIKNWALLSVQAGRDLVGPEIADLVARYAYRPIDTVGQLLFDPLWFIPESVFKIAFAPFKYALKATGKVLGEVIPWVKVAEGSTKLEVVPIKWLFEQAHTSRATTLGRTITNYTQRMAEPYDKMSEFYTDFRRLENLAYQTMDTPNDIVKLFDKERRVNRLLRNFEVKDWKAYVESFRSAKGEWLIEPKFWTDTLKASQDELIEEARFAYQRYLELNKGVKTEEAALRAAQQIKQLEEVKKIEFIEKFSSELQRAFLDPHKAFPGSRLIDDTVSGSISKILYGKGTSEAGRKAAQLIDNLSYWQMKARSYWATAVLSLKPAWVNRNVIDSYFGRDLIEGGNPFDDLITLYKNTQFMFADKVGFIPVEMGQSLARMGLNISESVPSRLLEGWRPGFNPISYWNYERARLLAQKLPKTEEELARLVAQRVANKIESPLLKRIYKSVWNGPKTILENAKAGLRAIPATFTDFNTAAEFTVRLRMFHREYFKALEILEPVYKMRGIEAYSDLAKKIYLEGWQRSGGSGAKMAAYLDSVLENAAQIAKDGKVTYIKGRPSWTLVFPEGIEKDLKNAGVNLETMHDALLDARSRIEDFVNNTWISKGRNPNADEITSFFKNAKNDMHTDIQARISANIKKSDVTPEVWHSPTGDTLTEPLTDLSTLEGSHPLTGKETAPRPQAVKTTAKPSNILDAIDQNQVPGVTIKIQPEAKKSSHFVSSDGSIVVNVGKAGSQKSILTEIQSSVIDATWHQNGEMLRGLGFADQLSWKEKFSKFVNSPAAFMAEDPKNFGLFARIAHDNADLYEVMLKSGGTTYELVAEKAMRSSGLSFYLDVPTDILIKEMRIAASEGKYMTAPASYYINGKAAEDAKSEIFAWLNKELKDYNYEAWRKLDTLGERMSYARGSWGVDYLVQSPGPMGVDYYSGALRKEKWDSIFDLRARNYNSEVDLWHNIGWSTYTDTVKTRRSMDEIVQILNGIDNPEQFAFRNLGFNFELDDAGKIIGGTYTPPGGAPRPLTLAEISRTDELWGSHLSPGTTLRGKVINFADQGTRTATEQLYDLLLDEMGKHVDKGGKLVDRPGWAGSFKGALGKDMEEWMSVTGKSAEDYLARFAFVKSGDRLALSKAGITLEEATHGAIRLSKDGRVTFFGFGPDRNIANLVHDSVAIRYTSIKEMAEFSPEYKKALDSIHDFMGITDSALTPTPEQFQKFGDSYVNYLLHGDLPEIKLKRAFVTYNDALSKTYEGLKAGPMAEALDPQVKLIFDQMWIDNSLNVPKATPHANRAIARELGMTDTEAVTAVNNYLKSSSTEALRIKESAGQPIFHNVDEARDAVKAAFAEQGITAKEVEAELKSSGLDTPEGIAKHQEEMINRFVEGPAQPTVRKLIAEGKYPFSSNAYNEGKKGVWYYDTPSWLSGEKVAKFEPLSTAPIKTLPAAQTVDVLSEKTYAAYKATAPGQALVEWHGAADSATLGANKQKLIQALNDNPDIALQWEANTKAALDKVYPNQNYVELTRRVTGEPKWLPYDSLSELKEGVRGTGDVITIRVPKENILTTYQDNPILYRTASEREFILNERGYTGATVVGNNADYYNKSLQAVSGTQTPVKHYNKLSDIEQTELQRILAEVKADPAKYGVTLKASAPKGPTQIEQSLSAALEQEIQKPQWAAFSREQLLTKDGHITYDSVKGMGAVPIQQEVSVRGFSRVMPASDVLKVAPPTWKEQSAVDRLIQGIRDGKPVAPAWFDVEWDAQNKVWKAISHEGRTRAQAINTLYPDDLMRVDFFPSKGMRAKDLTPEMISAPIIPQNATTLDIRVPTQPIPEPKLTIDSVRAALHERVMSNVDNLADHYRKLEAELEQFQDAMLKWTAPQVLKPQLEQWKAYQKAMRGTKVVDATGKPIELYPSTTTAGGNAIALSSDPLKVWAADLPDVLKNADGTPIPLYHGTNRDFIQYDLKMPGEGVIVRGVYLTSEPDIAGSYALYKGGERTVEGGANVRKVYADIKNPLVVGRDPLWPGGSADAASAWLKEKGYDAVINGKEIIVLDPKNIHNAWEIQTTAPEKIAYANLKNPFHTTVGAIDPTDAKVIDRLQVDALGNKMDGIILHNADGSVNSVIVYDQSKIFYGKAAPITDAELYGDILFPRIPDSALSQGTRHMMQKNINDVNIYEAYIRTLDSLEAYMKSGKAFDIRMIPQSVKNELIGLRDIGMQNKNEMVNIILNGGKVNGRTLEGAIPKTNRVMIDYGFSTRFDVGMSNVFPFWKFPSRTLPYWAETLATKPAIVAAYQKLQMLSLVQRYNAGATTSYGRAMPSLEGWLKVPGTDLWFNPLSPFSFSYLLDIGKQAGQMQYSVQEDQDVTPVPWLAREITDLGVLFGFSPAPWITFPAKLLLGIPDEVMPNLPITPQFSLFPRWHMTDVQQKSTAMATLGKAYDFFYPEISYHDALIQRQIYVEAAQHLKTIQNPADQWTYVHQIAQATSVIKLPGNFGPVRDQNPIWLKAVAEYDKSETKRSWLSYMVGYFVKPFTTAQADMKRVENENNIWKAAMNNQYDALMFNIPTDPTAAWDAYKTRLDTPVGFLYKLYADSNYVKSPSGDLITSPEEYAKQMAVLIENEEKQKLFYQGLAAAKQLKDQKLASAGVGAPREVTDPIYKEFYATQDMLYKNYNTYEGYFGTYAPVEIIQSRLEDQWWKMITTSYPTWHKGDDYFVWQNKVADWEANLPSLAQMFMVGTDIKGDSSFKQNTYVQSVLNALHPDQVIQQSFFDNLVSSTNAEGLAAWRLKNDGIIDALNKVWKENYWDVYWSSLKSGVNEDGSTRWKNSYDRNIAVEDFQVNNPTPDAKQLYDWLVPIYGNRFSYEEVKKYVEGSDVLSVDEILKSTNTDTEIDKLQQEIWDLVSLIGPGGVSTSKIYESIPTADADTLSVFQATGGRGFLDVPNNPAITAENLKNLTALRDALLNFKNSTLGANFALSREQKAEYSAARQQNENFQNLFKQYMAAAFPERWGVDPDFTFDRLMSVYSTFYAERERPTWQDYLDMQQYSSFRRLYAKANPLWQKYYRGTGPDPLSKIKTPLKPSSVTPPPKISISSLSSITPSTPPTVFSIAPRETTTIVGKTSIPVNMYNDMDWSLRASIMLKQTTGIELDEDDKSKLATIALRHPEWRKYIDKLLK